MELFLHSLLEILKWPTVGMMLLGIAIGFAVGILPGLGGGVTIALMLPFVFKMQPISAFAFLLGMHSVCATTGDITSVLFAVPGEATSAATILDGYPLTQRGESGRALGIVLFSSLVGAVIGAFFLALSVPIIRPLVLKFGPPEFFMLAVLGLSYVVALSGKSPTRGFLMAGFGFLLAMIGVDPHGAIPRYTFGSLYLWDGLDLVPVAVGLFAIPEILEILISRSSIARVEGDRLTSGAVQGIWDTFKYWSITVRASLIGVFIGCIPGMGGSVSQWIAYAHARQTSKHPELFGKGAIDGLLAVGAVNNSKEGGALIPTIAFGIPSGTSMAILLGAFMIMGLTPGPEMLTTHLDVTFSMVWTIVVSNIIAVTISFLMIKQLVSITKVKGTTLIPLLIILITMGAFTSNNSLNDVLAMLAFGVVGWACVRWEWPRPPILLAMVLGDVVERNLFLSYQLMGWDWLKRPIVLILAAITLAGLITPFISARRRAAKAAAEAAMAKGA